MYRSVITTHFYQLHSMKYGLFVLYKKKHPDLIITSLHNVFIVENVDESF